MIFVSTGGRNDRPASATAAEFAAAGIDAVELSGGRPHERLEADVIAMSARVVLQVHNYFPPPAKPFVLNLASPDPAIADATADHVRRAVDLAIRLGRPSYGFHAGYLVDPHVGELGRRIEKRTLHDRGAALDAFVSRVQDLGRWAAARGAELLIENNVLSAQNHEEFGGNPLLMTHADEIDAVMSRVPDNVGLLLDVAHLRVSARTLGLDPIAQHEAIRHWIRAYHLSDNDGTADTNEPVREDSWFWPLLRRDVASYTLEVYGTDAEFLKGQQELTRRKLAAEGSS